MAIDVLPLAPLSDLLERLERVLTKIERVLDARVDGGVDVDFGAVPAFIWQRRDGSGHFRPIRHVDVVRLDDLLGIEHQLEVLVRNTRQFLCGAPANHVLLWGERGCGKSSAVKAVLHAFAPHGLRLVQLSRGDLRDLPEIIDRVWERPEKFILFCDDLSFEHGDADYKELKALLEGGIQARPENVLLYATSNRRHLMPEDMADRRMVVRDGEVHPNEALGEQLSLADRFGIRLGFYRIDQTNYLRIVRHLAAARGLDTAAFSLDAEALRWAMAYSGFSGRSARQFVDDLQGRLALEHGANTVG